MSTFRCIIAGAAGRDFHDFLTFFQDRSEFTVCAFTAAQIPFISSRVFPKSLAGENYEADIPIYPEEQLPELISQLEIDFVFLAYSDLPHEAVMHLASLVQSRGAGFAVLGPKQTQLQSTKPVIAVTAVRTGAGKSPVTRWIARRLVENGRRPAILRHPMPYGDLEDQRVQKFSTQADLDFWDCTIEEREEYQPYLDLGLSIFAGVDYRAILTEAEADADVILWDGGNNDVPFFKPDLLITIADALRPGHETRYYPGESNFRMADVIIINKVSSAGDADVSRIREEIERCNPDAEVIESDLEIAVDHPEKIPNQKVLVVEDGPTLTHGGMTTGAGYLAATRFQARELIDPRPFAQGSIQTAFATYPQIGPLLPALGYSAEQLEELKNTIEAAGPDLIVDASPAGLAHVLPLSIPLVRVRYEFQQVTGPPLMIPILRLI